MVMATKAKIDEATTLGESQLNIDGLVATIKDTTVYTSIVEGISNAIHSIDASGRKDGDIKVELVRKNSLRLPIPDDENELNLPEIAMVKITDNGIGFTDENLQYCNEAYTRHKVEIGGKGFGRFVYLKHFTKVGVESVYKDGQELKRRTFKLGRHHQIVYDLLTIDADASDKIETTLNLEIIKDGQLDKKTETVARKLLDKLLVQFIRDDKHCPTITVSDDYTGKEFILNNLLGDTDYSEIQKMDGEDFMLTKAGVDYKFQLHLFKVWLSGNQQSKIHLTSHYIEVTDVPLDEYINEFESGFVGTLKGRGAETSNRFIIKAYVTGAYLDDHVDRDRTGYQFGKNADAAYPVGRAEIESKVADLIKDKYKGVFNTQRKHKTAKLTTIVENKPWLQRHMDQVDLTMIKVNASDKEYELAIETVRLKSEQDLDEFTENYVRSDAKQLADAKTEELIRDITESNKEDLARYVARRKAVIDILDKNLRANKETGKHEWEKVLHDTIYPMHISSDTISPDYQNLWLLDERLNFTEYISSDKAFSKQEKDRGDLFIFHNKVAFRAGEDKQNPITIVEFKRPGKDDFATPGHKDNPVDQVVKYANALRAGKFKQPGNRPIHTDLNTQIYAYIVIDFTEKVKHWLEFEEDFSPMPDGLGYYKWRTNTNLYIEVLSWDKLLKDAKLRNSIFSQKLGLHS